MHAKKTAPKDIPNAVSHEHPKLGQFFATAICGNDILSSALYVSGIAIVFGGIYAPLILAVVCIVLYFYKSVYTEVVEALPLNGGAYNCLLNTTSKIVAAIAGVMTILSYVATAVISAKIGVEYLNTILPLPVLPVTTVLLLGFALLVIAGIKDSAKVAFGIFITHIVALTAFLVVGFISLFNGHSFFQENITHTVDIIANQSGFINTFFLAFSASLLGVSGFESSANFVEEQKKGVFRKTLRNMLIGVAIFNPLIAYIVLNAMPYAAISGAKDFLLADAANAIGGPLFQTLIVIDAFMVLSGAVLTAFVGVSGLANRMTADGCLPSFLNKENKKGSFPRIIIGFFLLCSSILWATGGDLLSLAGVYTIAFLSVMSLFALGAFLLRQNRNELKKTYKAPIIFIFLAMMGTIIGIIGNIEIDSSNLTFFSIYFIPSFLIVLLFVFQDYFIQFLLRITKFFPGIQKYLSKNYEDLIGGSYIGFIYNIERLHKILNYLDKNETSRNLILIYCSNHEDPEKDSKYREFKEAIPILQRSGVCPHINVVLIAKNAEFGPKIIDEVSKEFGVRKNRILIGSIHDTHSFDYDELGGVRIIL